MSNETSASHPGTPDTILTRTLVLRTPDGIDHDFTVSMSMPVKVPMRPADMPAYSCAVRISGAGADISDYVVGHGDGFMAIFDALKFIRDTLDAMNGTVMFCDRPHSGFPLFIEDGWSMAHLHRTESYVREENQKLMDVLHQGIKNSMGGRQLIAHDDNPKA